ncbi:hypothetical protein EXIGLDRAFT_838129 [Exidia glandulosa HHB12029]|uniref:histidine kinase n=1 Tax=Exidia glandulosa HHB12029 TaxID=1314781 RepID=A0A165G472_EXIGL|nr:hypothetical protein EXIGLDRAFT_838129 [Exidia glandulosa HHB12029]
MDDSDAPSGLPLHHQTREGRSMRRRQLTFEHEGSRRTWRNILPTMFRRWVQASTGSPSDGFGRDASDSGASFSTFLTNQQQLDREKEDADWVLDEVVVNGEEAEHKHGSDKGTTTRQSESEVAGSVHRGTEHHSTHGDFRDTRGPMGFIRYTLWPNVCYFFDPKFEDLAKEAEYRKLVWYGNKKLAFFASLFLYVNWILYLIFNRSITTYEKYAYYGGLSFFTLPLPFMVVYNMPRKYPHTYQIWVCIAAWYCGIMEIIEMRQCSFFTPAHRHCGHKDFLAMMFYATAIPTLMMFVISHRLYNCIMQLVVLGLLLGVVLPVQSIFVRNIIGFAIYWIFMHGLHWSREMTERRMFMLNAQLKVAYRAQQKAQIAESKASHAKRRFASYIFHEVRVPLNTAMLAFHSLQTNNAFKADHAESQSIEIHALEASLFMMQQVLNDVLDLERMDSGRFESNPRPFPLHRAINSIMGPVGLASDAKRLSLRMALDKKIDELADTPVDEGLWVVGDEIRLRQVLTNLASNAVKFTPDGGGEVALTTKLLEYHVPKRPTNLAVPSSMGSHDKETPSTEPALTLTLAHRSDSSNPSQGKDGHVQVPTIRFRLEVSDSGPGIRPSDLVEHRLFQPFVQTAVGKSSGKGTGLGLAIVRQIVTLSGGRLGVQSRRGRGATFWVELSYPIATAQEVQLARSSTPVPTPPLVKQRHAPRVAKAKSDADMLGIASYTDPHSNPLAFVATSPQTSPPPPPDILTSSVPPAKRKQPNGGGSSFSPPDNPLTCLVVDDDELTRKMMSRVLERQGCVVETASDGREFLELLLTQGRRYDIITLDNFMPNVSGEEAVRELREAGRDDLVVGCTGNALTEDQTSYLDAGADRVLTKPINMNQLKDCLLVALQRRTPSAPESTR